MLNLLQHPSCSIFSAMPIAKSPCVFILASGHAGTIHTGLRPNLMQRLAKYREGITKGFASRYTVWRLVHFEVFGDMERAMTRDKLLKNGKRAWKINLIQGANPERRDLAVGLGFPPLAPRLRKDGP